MKIQLSNKVKKRLSGLTALTLSAAILLSGTFAWQSISQTATNKASGVANPGGRLHDYFDGQNKDVFVENFTDPDDNGVPIFARIRLDEYMEIGPDAGKKTDQADRNVTVIGKTDAKIDDSTTWITHKPGHLPGGEIGNTHTPMHEYWEWEMGGKGVYMPTFNMDKDNKDSDINGTYEGPDGVAGENGGVDDRYQDYTKYEVGNTKEAVENYANSQTSVGNQTHTAKETLDGTVITMEEWLAKDEADRIGPMWVYDNDGWAYWAQPIQPGTATGLLLNGIKPVRQPDQEWYYAINVIGQFATAGDWGKKEDDSGFFEDGITDDALNLLNKVADRLPQVVHMLVKNGFKQYVAVGDTLPLEVTADVKNPTGTEADTYVTWTCDPDVGTALLGNKFTPIEDMVGKTYRMTATSVLTPAVTTYVDVVVMPKEAAGGNGVVEGALDKKKYINYGDNTYKEVKEDGSLGDWRCAGKDMIIGNTDDRPDVFVVEKGQTTQFGSKFLGPIRTGHGEYYLAMGADNMLGTADDIKVVSTSTFPKDLTNILATNIEITIPTEIQADNKVKPGYNYHFEYKVMNNGEESVIQDITWSIKNTDTLTDPDNTKITQDGYLYIGGNEKFDNVITIRAEAKNLNGDPVVAEKDFAVRDWEVSDLKTVNPGTITTVKIDNVDFYLMARMGNEVLLWAKDPYGVDLSSSDNNVRYNNSALQNSCTAFLNEHEEIKKKAVSKVIYDVWHSSTPMTGEKIETIQNQQAFVLTYYDLDAKKTGGMPQDYTFNNAPLIKDDNPVKEQIKQGGGHTLTRTSGTWSDNRNNYHAAFVGTSGNASSGSNYKIRPALWYRLD